MSSEMNAATIPKYLRPSELPEGVSRQEVDEVIRQMGEKSRQLQFLANNGPMPGPTDQGIIEKWYSALGLP